MRREEVCQSKDHNLPHRLYVLKKALGDSDNPSLETLRSTWLTSSASLQSAPSINSNGNSITSVTEAAQSLSNDNFAVHGKPEKMSNPVSSYASRVNDASCPLLSANSWSTSFPLCSTQSRPSPSVTSIPGLDTFNCSSDPAIEASCDSSEQIRDSIFTRTSADGHQHTEASILMGSVGSSLSGVTENSMWRQILLDNSDNEALQNVSLENFQDVLFSRVLRQGNEFLIAGRVNWVDSMSTCDLPLRAMTFEGDEMNLETLDGNRVPSVQYSQIIDADLLSSTAHTRQDMQTWAAAADRDQNKTVSQSTRINASLSGSELPIVRYEHPRIKHENSISTSQNEQCRVERATALSGSHNKHLRIQHENPSSINEHPSRKQQYPLPYTVGDNSSIVGGASPPFSFQICGTDTYKRHVLSQHQMQASVTRGASSNFAGPSVQHDFSGKLSGSHFSRFPPVIPRMLPSASVSEQPAKKLPFSVPHVMDMSAPMPDINLSTHGQIPHFSSTSQYIQGYMEWMPLNDDSSKIRTMRHIEENRETTSDPMKSAASLNSCESTSHPLFKRPRLDADLSSFPCKQPPRKEKLRDRITALQQLVSPFGKTDTASVLLEAIGYIKFLQEQVQVLSAPYIKITSTISSQQDMTKKAWTSERNQASDEPKLDLRTRGLCLFPISCTMNVANQNDPDHWSPSLGIG